jgi:transcriptional regulator with XRE-family HTH domain
MATDSIYENMAALASSEPSGWLEDARWRLDNRVWLRRSQSIALKILRTLRARMMTQKDLAGIVGVSSQQVSKIVKGRENLTLETIAKLEKALGIVLMEIPKYTVTMSVDRVLPAEYVSAFTSSSTHSYVKRCEEPYATRSVPIENNEIKYAVAG